MTDMSLPRSNQLIFLMVNYILWASVSLRWVLEFIEQQHPLTVLLSAMLVLYGILMGLEPVISGGDLFRTQAYLVFQTSLVFIAVLFYFELDFFAILYLPLSGQATLTLPRASARWWVLVLIVVTFAGQLTQFGWPQALPFTFLYVAGIVFISLVSENMMQIEAARKHSESLLAALQEAHQQLKAYADQAEALAVFQERNRLARELHDSIAQTLYGFTLRSEAALRKLKQGDTESVSTYLQEFQDSAKQSLKETRLLIFELRPEILDREGLRAALVTRLESVERRSGLALALDIADLQNDIPQAIEAALYRIAQEALNNVLKHAQASKVQVTLHQAAEILRMTIQDNGVGFPNADHPRTGGMGLQGMKERAEQIGAELQITSIPGQGVCITVEVSL